MNAINIVALTLLLLLTNVVHGSCLKTKVTGEGQAILLMPGFLSDESVWQNVATELAKDFQVHQLSIAGFGKNKPCKHADDIFQHVFTELSHYVNSPALKQPVFIGHSMGGLMAYQLALTPHKTLKAAISVDGLPFIGPVFTRTNDTTIEDIAFQATSISHLYRHATPERLAQISRQGIAIQTTQKDKYQHIIDMAKSSDPITASSAIKTVMTMDLRENIAKLTTPMLLIGAAGGFNDTSQQRAVKNLYAAQLGGNAMATIVMNNKGRHFLMWDQPKWLINTIKDYIKEQS
ncbi:alpha/beta fold hydrolase [Thalassotalea sediminis]|uniref:alpha/beta fold hydrolase n=1 Tax=Thalassotalea sediminis TaxID=1759089 RepID=UPI002573D835|nr:alpha/beta hydrolase [Thalassotalea sediminis]